MVYFAKVVLKMEETQENFAAYSHFSQQKKTEVKTHLNRLDIICDLSQNKLAYEDFKSTLKYFASVLKSSKYSDFRSYIIIRLDELHDRKNLNLQSRQHSSVVRKTISGCILKANRV